MSLINSDISQEAFARGNNILKEYDGMKKKSKNLESINPNSLLTWLI